MATLRISVPQNEGEVRIMAVDLGAPFEKTYTVSNGVVEVEDQDCNLFLKTVPGAVTAPPAAAPSPTPAAAAPPADAAKK